MSSKLPDGTGEDNHLRKRDVLFSVGWILLNSVGFMQRTGNGHINCVPRSWPENTVRSLVGPDADLPEGIAEASLRPPPGVGSANVLRERNPQLSAINSGGWEKITLIVDSGASDTVIPPKVCRAAEIRSSSKVGTEYEVADGGVAKNLGEKLCEMKVNKNDDIGLEIAFQVVDKVNKALLSVH